MSSEAVGVRPRSDGRVSLTALVASGVVFGDIATSPLYALDKALGSADLQRDPSVALGALSLVLWALLLITTVKYVTFAMRADNDGEGGIIALMTLLDLKRRKRPIILAIGLFGAAVMYGYGAIMPAISVLSALEGVKRAEPTWETYVLPAATAILIALFAVQAIGASAIARAIGPIMLVWFLVIAALGVYGVLRHPSVFAAVDPSYGVHYLMGGGRHGFVVLGSVLLCVTGAEALYASIGRGGPGPIRFSWSFVVFPALILNYAGQTAMAIFDASAGQTATAIGGHFYRLCPEPLLLTPLIVLATLASISASQSIITSAHSMTRQVVQLGWLPRVAITQTSEESYGETYVGTVNWILMIATLGLTISFGKSDNLEPAYGIAASATMLMTSVLLFIAMREIWRWSIWAAGAVAAIFVLIDASFFAANMTKFFEGGWVPLLLASLVYGVMWIWHRGAVEVQRSVEAELTPLSSLLEKLHAGEVARVPGTAVFLTRAKDQTPPVMAWHVRHARALHEYVLALTLTVLSVPWTDREERVSVARIDDKFWRAEARLGFMRRRPDIPRILAECKAKGAEIDLDDVTYFVGHETIIPRENGRGMARWQQILFAAMGRNAERISDYLDLPSEQVVEIGRQIEI